MFVVLSGLAIVTELLNETHKTTKKYRDAVRQAREHQQDEQMLSHKLWWAQYNDAQGEKLSDMVGDGDVDFYFMTWTNRSSSWSMISTHEA